LLKGHFRQSVWCSWRFEFFLIGNAAESLLVWFVGFRRLSSWHYSYKGIPPIHIPYSPSFRRPLR